MSWDEDCAYRRLLDIYYTTEQPLPLEPRAVFRLAMATTDEQRAAVTVVLEEFFERTEHGWINRRAEAELNAMRDKQVLNETRDAHERERMRRHRERRAEMFAALRERGVVPAWDVSIKELQNLFNQHCKDSAVPATTLEHAEQSAACNVTEKNLQREQGVSGGVPATAIPTPTPTPIQETPLTPPAGGRKREPRKTRCPADFAPAQSGIDLAAANGVSVQTELPKFVNHHTAKGSLMADWQAAWRTWVGKAVEFNRARQPQARRERGLVL